MAYFFSKFFLRSAWLGSTCDQSYKHFTIENYDSRGRTWLENTPYYNPRVVIYERKMFIRLATGGRRCSYRSSRIGVNLFSGQKFRFWTVLWIISLCLDASIYSIPVFWSHGKKWQERTFPGMQASLAKNQSFELNSLFLAIS